jgi:hypothetical protein
MSGALPETVPTAAPATPLPAPANVLTYDNLPPHSTLLREVLVDHRTGETCVKITAPATEAAPATRLAIARSAAITAAATTFVALGVCAIPFAMLAWRQRHLVPWWTAIVFAVFCAALFALIWRNMFLSRLATTEKFLGSSTVLVVSPSRLLIECSGPGLPFSYEFAAKSVREVRVTRALHAERDSSCLLHGLQIALSDGTDLNLLCGRSREELAWVAATIRSTMQVSV